VPSLRLNQLPPDQLGRRAQVLNALEPAGYEPTDAEVALREGLSFDKAASLARHNGALEIRFEIWNDAPRATIVLTRDDGQEIRLQVDEGGRLDQLLRFLIAHQDEITDSTYQTIVRQLVKEFPKTYADLGEEGRRLLVDEKGNLNWPDE